MPSCFISSGSLFPFGWPFNSDLTSTFPNGRGLPFPTASGGWSWHTFPRSFFLDCKKGCGRFFSLRDCFVTAAAVTVGAVLAGCTYYLVNGFSFERFPRSSLIITSLLLLLWEVGARGVLRLIREYRIGSFGSGAGEQRRVILVGNPDEADSLLRNLVRHPRTLGRVVGLVSDSERHQGQSLRGIKIHGGAAKVPDLVRNQEINTILFLPPFDTPARINEVIKAMSDQGLTCDYRTIPSMESLASGKVNVEEFRKVSIEDLLYRLPHKIDLDIVRSAITGSRILVTGAGGSIGSEICRQILHLEPESLTLFDASEFALFEIERELRPKATEQSVALHAVAGDVRQSDQLKNAIQLTDGVDVFYHAAAYKHVDLMERNPAACLRNNVIGTQVAATVAESFGVGDFVLISSDKAVRPTSLMGASKRLAERVVIERPQNGTRFKAVRFGNVLGSSGSVIPIFRQQIAEGGPVTVTSRNVTRYFMTIPEAVELVIAAGTVTEDRRICVLEMGDPVKIDDLARRMIELSGYIPDVDIEVVYTGLKSGEKEFEELLTDDEGVVRTDYDRIWVLKKSAEVNGPPLDLGELIELLDCGDGARIREWAHRLVPGSLLLPETQTDEVPTK